MFEMKHQRSARNLLPEPAVLGTELEAAVEILEPGRLSISGETDARGGWLRRAEMVGGARRFFKGGKRLGELVAPLAAKAAGHELRFPGTVSSLAAAQQRARAFDYRQG